MPDDERAPDPRGELLRPAAARIGDVHDLEVVAQARERRQVQRGHARALLR